MTAIILTPQQRELARHALGLPNKMRRSYRNRFYASAGTRDYFEWIGMVEAAAARHARPGPDEARPLHFFCLTRPGAEAALDPRERLCPEDFPPTYIFRWDRCGRKGQPCRMSATGALNSARVIFPDGFTMITDRRAVRRLKPSEPDPWEGRP